MLNMALLNIMNGAGGGSMPDTSPYNIFGLLAPCINTNKGGHYPHIVMIWNRYLTTFEAPVRCDDNDIHETMIGVGGTATICEADAPRINFSGANATSAVLNWGISTKPLYMVSRLRMGWGFVDFSYVGQMDWVKKNYEDGILNELALGYADYYNHLTPIPSALTFASASVLSDLVGGSVWQVGVSTLVDGKPAYNAVYAPFANRTPLIDGVARPANNWNMMVVPIRGLTSYPKDDLSNSMVYGYMQLEYPNQIGLGLSYSFGVAKDSNCLPKQSLVKCGGQLPGLSAGLPLPDKLFPGVAPFNLDNFLKPFIRNGVLSGYGDAANVYAKLQSIILEARYQSEGAPTFVEGSAAFEKTRESIWQGLIDGWLEQPYKDIFNEIGDDSEFFITALQRHYPTQCNFYSIMGCGRSYDRGAEGNASICAMLTALSVFKALSTFPEEFPVDLPRLVRAT